MTEPRRVSLLMRRIRECKGEVSAKPLLASAVLTIALASSILESRGAPPGGAATSISVEELVIRDGEGKRRIRLGMDADSPGRSSIRMYSSSGKELIGIEATDLGGNLIMFNTSGKARFWVTIEDESSQLMMFGGKDPAAINFVNVRAVSTGGAISLFGPSEDNEGLVQTLRLP